VHLQLTAIIGTHAYNVWYKFSELWEQKARKLDLKGPPSRQECLSVHVSEYPCIFIQPTRCNLYNVLYYYRRSTFFGWYFRPSSGAYKTVCTALGIVMLSCCLLLVWMGWNSNMLTRAWQQLEYRINVCRVTRGAHIEHL